MKTADPMKKALRYRWLIFSLLAISYVLVYFHRFCPAVLALDIMKDLKTGGAITGLLAAAYFYPYALMQIPAGLLSDSWGPRNTITLFFMVAFTGSIILGMAHSVATAMIGRTLVGIGVAMLFVPTLKILAEWFHVKEFAFMTGILMAMGGVGSLTAATPLVMLSAWVGWRQSFIIVGVATLVVAVFIWFLVKDRPSDFGWPSPAGTEKRPGPSIGLLESMKQVLTCRHFWPLAIWFFFALGTTFSFGGLWGGPYLIQIYHMSKAEAGKVLSMMAFGLVFGSLFLSFLSDKIFKGRKPVLILSASIMILITGLLAFYTDKIPIPGLYALFFFFAVFSSAIVVIGFTMNKELFPVQIAGTSTGLVNLFPFTGGAVFQPVLGYILEAHGKTGDAFTLAGYQSAFLVLFISSLIVFSASLATKETMVKLSPN